MGVIVVLFKEGNKTEGSDKNETNKSVANFTSMIRGCNLNVRKQQILEIKTIS